MKSVIKRIIWIITIVAMFTCTMFIVPLVYPSDSTADDKISNFLSDVVGLDLTKYVLPQASLYDSGLESSSEVDDFVSETLNNNFRYPPELGGLVEQQVLNPKLQYEENTIDVMGIFYNGHLAFLKLYPYSQDDYIYSELPPTDILSNAKSIIQRYQSFVLQNYADDGTYLTSMQNVLDNIDDLSPKEITEGDVNFQVSKDGDKTLIQWIFTQDGVSMKWKRVSISFRNNAFESFRDTWGLYSVSGLSAISSDSAVQIALKAANNCHLRIGRGDGQEAEVVAVPDLSNAPYNVNFYMVPFRYQENDVPSKISRDPLTLYPYWQIHFYFNKSIAGCTGIQVGVWGDTSEIIYCSGFGYHGTSEAPNESLVEQIHPKQMELSTLLVLASLVAVPIISLSIMSIRQKKRNK